MNDLTAKPKKNSLTNLIVALRRACRFFVGDAGRSIYMYIHTYIYIHV